MDGDSGIGAPSRVSVERDVVFARAGEHALLADIYRPPQMQAGAPAVLLVHGGAWRAGHRAHMHTYGIRLALEGFLCVSSSYRLTHEAPWPAQIHDVKNAIRWVRGNAERLGIDPHKLAAVGASAGGHLALLAAATSHTSILDGPPEHTEHADVPSELDAVVAIFAPTLLSPGDARQSGATPAGSLLEDASDGEAARLASPLSHVTGDHPPTFLIHGTGDKLVPPSASLRLYERLVEAGVPVELHMYAEQPHGFVAQREFNRLNAREIALFLQGYLGVKPRVDMPRIPGMNLTGFDPVPG